MSIDLLLMPNPVTLPAQKGGNYHPNSNPSLIINTVIVHLKSCFNSSKPKSKIYTSTASGITFVQLLPCYRQLFP